MDNAVHQLCRRRQPIETVWTRMAQWEVMIMCTADGRATRLLADALVDTATHSDCVAILLKYQRSEDLMPWCQHCPDSGDCWAWNSRGILTWQEIAEAQSRHKKNSRQKWERGSGGRPVSPIQVVARCERHAG